MTYIHVHQHYTNITNKEWKKTPQNGAPFVTFYDMRAVTFVLPGEMANVSITGLQWFIVLEIFLFWKSVSKLKYDQFLKEFFGKTRFSDALRDDILQ